MKKIKYILDSSAVLALLQGEPGSAKVEPLLDQAVLSVVNLSEILGILVLKGVPANEARVELAGLVQDIAPFSEDMAEAAARLIAKTKPLGLSLGDRACLATAEILNLEAVTADKAWTRLASSTRVLCIR